MRLRCRNASDAADTPPPDDADIVCFEHTDSKDACAEAVGPESRTIVDNPTDEARHNESTSTTHTEETNCERSFPSERATSSPFTMTNLQLQCKELEKNLETVLLAFFHFVQDDIRNNTHLLFIIGMLAGGAFGARCGALSLAFGLGVFSAHRYIMCVHAALSICCLAEALTDSGDYATLGWYQMGHSLFDVLESKRLHPRGASTLTLGVVTAVSPSINLGILIVLKHCYDAFSSLVR